MDETRLWGGGRQPTHQCLDYSRELAIVRALAPALESALSDDEVIALVHVLSNEATVFGDGLEVNTTSESMVSVREAAAMASCFSESGMWGQEVYAAYVRSSEGSYYSRLRVYIGQRIEALRGVRRVVGP